MRSKVQKQKTRDIRNMAGSGPITTVNSQFLKQKTWLALINSAAQETKKNGCSRALSCCRATQNLATSASYPLPNPEHRAKLFAHGFPRTFSYICPLLESCRCSVRYSHIPIAIFLMSRVFYFCTLLLMFTFPCHISTILFPILFSCLLFYISHHISCLTPTV